MGNSAGSDGTVRRGNCPTCGQALPQSHGDEAIVASLAADSFAMLYAAARPQNSKLGDTSRWFVSGPQSRPGYVKGPFSREQVRRIVKTGEVHMLCLDQAGEPCAYVHRRHAHTWPNPTPTKDTSHGY